jgi:hypothetical protein
MIANKTRAKSVGLQLLRAINTTQAHGQEGVRAAPSRVAHETGLNLGDVGSERYHHALGYLVEKTALVGNEHTAGSSSSGQPLRTGPPGAERTPAIAAGLTDHRWTMEELLAFPVPPGELPSWRGRKPRWLSPIECAALPRFNVALPKKG